MDKVYGETARRFRKMLGMTLEQAGGTSIPRSTLSDFERGKSDLKLTDFINLLRNLGISTDDFFRNADLDTTGDAFQMFYAIWDYDVQGRKNEMRRLILKMEKLAETGAIEENWYFGAKMISSRLLPELFTKKDIKKVLEWYDTKKIWWSSNTVNYLIFIAASSAFDIETLKKLGNKLIESQNAGNDHGFYTNPGTSVVAACNIGGRMLMAGEIAMAVKLLNFAKNVSEDYTGLTGGSTLALTGAIRFAQNNGIGKLAELGKKEMLKALEISELTKSPSYAEQGRENYELIIAKYSNQRS